MSLYISVRYNVVSYTRNSRITILAVLILIILFRNSMFIEALNKDDGLIRKNVDLAHFGPCSERILKFARYIIVL